jgi:DNA-binding NarL/FixJ family response regulator
LVSEPDESGSRLRIVAVEDDASYAETLRQVLEARGDCEWVRSFRSPVEFLASVTALRPDLILLDISLPKLSGLDCIAEVRKAVPECRVLIVSAYDNDEFVLRAFLEGADGYLLKDSSPADISQAVDDARRGGAPMSPGVARDTVKTHIRHVYRKLEVGNRTEALARLRLQG